MMGYGAVSQPVKPQPMLDTRRAGTPEQYRKLADYLATINLSSVDHWQYELKTLPRPKGRDTRAIVTEYDMVRLTTEPHDVLVDKDGYVWYTDFGEMYIGRVIVGFVNGKAAGIGMVTEYGGAAWRREEGLGEMRAGGAVVQDGRKNTSVDAPDDAGGIRWIDEPGGD